jgi:hypothetical protein
MSASEQSFSALCAENVGVNLRMWGFGRKYLLSPKPDAWARRGKFGNGSK